MQFAPGARRLAAYALVAALPFVFVPFGVAVVVLAPAFVLWFHRDPERSSPESGVVAPADGTVSVIREEDDWLRVGVYMSAADVHVNRAPKSGFLEHVTHTPGAHKPAFSKDSERNERVTFQFGDYEVVLIAGAFARRIHPRLEPGRVVERGDRIGHISFGSRADVKLPPTYEKSDVLVEEGDTVRAGETILVDEA
ncbi:protein sorting system archaetidylserine decarboxylase [Salarchaeum japonicum]|uniref:protein sorting system archaetidylserine decarboxylase n=1 Tax=Salarchaeum japonicum TaxID=555573 RepID=UPI003C78AD83